MDLSAFVDRLKAAGAFRVVGGAAEFSAVADTAPPTPCIYALPMGERAQPNALLGAISQRTICRIGLLIGTRNVRDASGQAAADSLSALRAAALDSVLGWQPTADATPVEFREGRLMRFADGVLWWQDDYEYEWDLRR
ncbi:MAG: hypothetical protein JSS57_16350 [Proteobacteria bacterium]|nr:hypothetical protein [Pseudomonadota bacterium]